MRGSQPPRPCLVVLADAAGFRQFWPCIIHGEGLCRMYIGLLSLSCWDTYAGAAVAVVALVLQSLL